MVSPLMEGAFQFGGERLALGAALQFPSLAAAELERKGTFNKEALAQAEHFALTDYLSALAGPPLTGRRGEGVLREVAQMTGCRRVVIPSARLHPRGLCEDLQSGDHKIVSHYDATFAVGRSLSRNTDSARVRDPFSTASFAPMAAPSSPMRATNSASKPT